MKKLVVSSLLLLLTVFGFGFALSPQASAIDVLKPVCDTAQGNAAGNPTVCAENKGGDTNPLLGSGSLFEAVVRILSFIAAVSAIAVIVVAGLKIVFSNGDSNTIATSRRQIIFAVVGLAVIMGANAIISLVINRVINA
jgi:hypothetical protein